MKKICIISYSNISQDARVLRQIQYLSQKYSLVIIGYGDPHPNFPQSEKIRWINVPRNKRSFLRILTDIIRIMRYLIGLPDRQDVLRSATLAKCDVYHANNWDALPVAAMAAKKNRAMLVLDIHESLQTASGFLYNYLNSAVVKRFAGQINACTTVVKAIANDYERKFGLSPVVLRNIPSFPNDPVSFKKTASHKVFLVHHGAAAQARRTDLMIRMMALCDSRYELHFILTNFASSYVGKLKQLADNIVPGRVFFHSPLPSMQIVNGISKYDVGFYSLTPTNYNNLIALPNKLFEFIAAGLAVCIGPSPSMAEIVNQYGCGIVSPSFKPEDLAAILNNTSSLDWDKMKRSSIIATNELNADKEMRILLEIYESLFSEKII